MHSKTLIITLCFVGHLFAYEQILPVQDAPAIIGEELQQTLSQPNYYDVNYRYKGGDYLGKLGGTYSAGLLDAFGTETQFQFAIPTQSFNLSNTTLTFNPDNGGQGAMMWMSLAMVQEYFHADLQWIIATGMKETFFMTSAAGNYINDASGYTPFEIEAPSLEDQVYGSWPTFYPHSLSIDGYLGPAGTSGKDLTDRAWAVNGVLAKHLLSYTNYAQLMQTPIVAFKRALENSFEGGDPDIGMCILSLMYNRGPLTSGASFALIPPKCTNGSMVGMLDKVLDNPNACATLAAAGQGGVGNYTLDIKSTISVLEQASKNAEFDPKIQLIDRWITLDELKEFWFGIGGDVNTPNNQQKGGLLLQGNYSQATKEQIWTNVKSAFDEQSKKWPVVGGKAVISLRYDWLTNLRRAKNLLDRDLTKVVFPTWKLNFMQNSLNQSLNKECQCPASNQVTWPDVQISTQSFNGNDLFDIRLNHSNLSDREIAKVEWTTQHDWAKYNTTQVERLTKEDVPQVDWKIISPQSRTAAKIDLKLTDICGNSMEKSNYTYVASIQKSWSPSSNAQFVRIQSAQELQNMLQNQRGNLRIYDMKGNLIQDLSKLAAGFYWIE